jgi:hypothetical protein
MTHAGVEQSRTRFEGVKAILRAIELPGHGQDINHAVIPEDAHVGAPENLGLRGEVDAVTRCGDARDLRPDIVEAMEIHDDLPPQRIDMHIRRGDMRGRDLGEQIMGHLDAALLPPSLE